MASGFEFKCDSPRWAIPSESHHGTFSGDLILDCWVNELEKRRGLSFLKDQLIKKIHLESMVHKGPTFVEQGPISFWIWEISHDFVEQGNSVHIREEVKLSLEANRELVYETLSKEVVATGMAGYLRSVNFEMAVRRVPGKFTQIRFRNQVKVDRPWYALDLIFAPIARGVCFDKMNLVKDRLLLWVIQVLE